MPIDLSTRPRPNVAKVLARLRQRPRPVPQHLRTRFDSSDPAGLVQRLQASDCFCRDTKAGRLYHPSDVSFREVSPRDSLHITVRDGRTVTTHVDRHSPLARRQTGGDCRYSPLRIAAHNVSGATRDLVRLVRGERRASGDGQAATSVDDEAVDQILNAKQAASVPFGDVAEPSDGTDLSGLPRSGSPRPGARGGLRRGPR